MLQLCKIKQIFNPCSLLLQPANYTAGQPIGILMVTVLLGYIDHRIASKNITLVTFHYNVIMINALTCSKYVSVMHKPLKGLYRFKNYFHFQMCAPQMLTCHRGDTG